MKRFLVSLSLLGTLMVLAAYAGDTEKSAAAKPAKAKAERYLVISPHTEEECMAALDAVEASGPKMLEKWDFGCMSGDHTGYAIVTAKSPEEALNTVPASMREKARAVQLHRFTPAELKAAHEKMKS